MSKFVQLYNRIFREVIYYKPTLCYCQLRIMSSEGKQVSREDADVVGYTKRDDDFKISRAATIRKLCYLLNIDEFQAVEIASKNAKLCEITGHQLSTNYRMCLESGLEKTTIEKCIDILAIRDLSGRLSYVSKLGNINDLAPLLRLPILTLIKFKKDTIGIYRMAELLEVPPFEITEQFVKKPSLLRLSPQKLINIVKLLKENGITGQMIANDLTALKYSEDTIRDRFEYAKQHNVPELKTWMIRADPKIFRNYIKIRSDNKEILGDKSVSEFLSERLDCSLAAANYLVDKLPALNNKSVKKMSEVIAYLYAQGFTPSHICRVPTILLHSIETTKKRLEKLAALGVEVNTLYVLIKSQKAFQEFYDNLVRSLKKRKKLEG